MILYSSKQFVFEGDGYLLFAYVNTVSYVAFCSTCVAKSRGYGDQLGRQADTGDCCCLLLSVGFMKHVHTAAELSIHLSFPSHL